MPFHERVLLAHDPLEVGELPHHDRHLVGLGQLRRFQRALPGYAGSPRRLAQIAHQRDQPLGLVAHGAGLDVEHDLVELGGHGFQAGDLVLLERELGVLDPPLQHPLVPGGDLLGPGRVAVAHVEEAVGERPSLVDQREVPLVRLHGRDQYLGRQRKMMVGEQPLRDRGLLDQEQHLFELAVRIDHVQALLAGHPFQLVPDEPLALPVIHHDAGPCSSPPRSRAACRSAPARPASGVPCWRVPDVSPAMPKGMTVSPHRATSQRMGREKRMSR